MHAADAEKAVAETLRKLRQDAGWSQIDLASRMCTRGWPWHQQTVTRIEGGKQPLRVGELADLADVFGVPLAALLGDHGERDAAGERRAMERAIREQLAAEIIGGRAA